MLITSKEFISVDRGFSNTPTDREKCASRRGSGSRRRRFDSLPAARRIAGYTAAVSFIFSFFFSFVLSFDTICVVAITNLCSRRRRGRRCTRGSLVFRRSREQPSVKRNATASEDSCLCRPPDRYQPCLHDRFCTPLKLLYHTAHRVEINVTTPQNADHSLIIHRCSLILDMATCGASCGVTLGRKVCTEWFVGSFLYTGSALRIVEAKWFVE